MDRDARYNALKIDRVMIKIETFNSISILFTTTTTGTFNM